MFWSHINYFCLFHLKYHSNFPYFLFFFFLTGPCGLQDLSSLLRDWTQALGSESAGVLTTGLPGNSQLSLLLRKGRSCSPTLTHSVKNNPWTYLVAQWIRIHLPTQGTQVRSLVQEYSTCLRATKPTCHNYWVCEPQLLKPTQPRASK